MPAETVGDLDRRLEDFSNPTTIEADLSGRSASCLGARCDEERPEELTIC